MRKSIQTAIKVVLAVALLGYLVSVIEPSRLLATASRARLPWIVGALLFMPVNLLLETTVWHRLVRRVASGVSFGRAGASLLCGYPLGSFTPARIGELAGRAFYLEYPDKWELAAVVFTQRMMDMVVAINLGLGALVYFILAYAPSPLNVWWGLVVFGAGTSIFLTTLAFRPSLAYGIIYRFAAKEKIRRRAAFLRTLSSRTMAGLLGIVALRYLTFASQFVLLLFAFAPALGVLQSFVGASLVFYANFLIPSLTIMDIGIREGAAVFFFGTFGVAEAVAFNASFLLFCINLLLPALVGLPFVLRMRLDSPDLFGDRSSLAPAPAETDQSS